VASVNTSTHPRFAVVGHPNKGKSSIVASLALDTSVQISDTPGTTTLTRAFPLRVDGVTLYELFDTPGFQRARKVLAWLKTQDIAADKRPEAVRAFIRAHKDDSCFADEIALLEPIMAGAGIIYVVDGAKPYGDEYEAEMEILRWTGQPSMALINRIGSHDHTAQWERALGQYFKLIRRYDPMRHDFDAHITLLEGMAQLHQDWIKPIKVSIRRFQEYHGHLRRETAESIAHLIVDSVSHVEKITLDQDTPTEADQEQLKQRYQESLRQMEANAQKNVEKIWHYAHLEKEQDHLMFEGLDLFSRKSVSLFGLSRRDLLLNGSAAGAAVGAGFDLMTGMGSMFMGAAVGAVAGATGGYFGFDKLSKVRAITSKLQRRYLKIGPMENHNFPYILLGRALYHAHTVATRSHAQRGTVELAMEAGFSDRWKQDKLPARLERYHKKFRTEEKPDSTLIAQYADLILEALDKLENGDV